MAKLCAHGEVYRLSKERNLSLDEDDLIRWERSELALCKDGKVLRKRTVIFRSNERRHDWGWKLWSRLVQGATLEGAKASLMERGWKEVL